MKYLGNRLTDLRKNHREEVFGPSFGSLRSRSKVKGQGHQGKNDTFLGGLRAVYVFGKTSVASSFILMSKIVKRTSLMY